MSEAQTRRDIALLQETVRFQAGMIQCAMSQIATMRTEINTLWLCRERSTMQTENSDSQHGRGTTALAAITGSGFRAKECV